MFYCTRVRTVSPFCKLSCWSSTLPWGLRNVRSPGYASTDTFSYCTSLTRTKGCTEAVGEFSRRWPRRMTFGCGTLAGHPPGTLGFSLFLGYGWHGWRGHLPFSEGELMGSTCRSESAGPAWHRLRLPAPVGSGCQPTSDNVKKNNDSRNSGVLHMRYFIAVPRVSALITSFHPCAAGTAALAPLSQLHFSFRFYICYIISLRVMFGLCSMHTWWNYSFELLVSMPINNMLWQCPAFFPSECVNGCRDWMAIKTHGWSWNKMRHTTFFSTLCSYYVQQFYQSQYHKFSQKKLCSHNSAVQWTFLF